MPGKVQIHKQQPSHNISVANVPNIVFWRPGWRYFTDCMLLHLAHCPPASLSVPLQQLYQL